MAIYHLSVKAHSRAKGESAVACAAYRSGSELRDERTGEVHDFTRKGGVVSADIVLPDDAPEWARDRQQLWNAVECAEKRKDSKVAREIEIALPVELSSEDRRDLTLAFTREVVKEHGFAADCCIHEPGKGDDRNHHAHILLSTRRLGADGFGEKTLELDDKRTSSAIVTKWRERWAEMCNEKLRERGIEAWIDHRSLEEQGIDREPTKHLGPKRAAILRKGGYDPAFAQEQKRAREELWKRQQQERADLKNAQREAWTTQQARGFESKVARNAARSEWALECAQQFEQLQRQQATARKRLRGGQQYMRELERERAGIVRAGPLTPDQIAAHAAALERGGLLGNLIAKRNGDLVDFESEQEGGKRVIHFTDDGRRLMMFDRSEDSLNAALRIAAAKQGGKVSITGSAEFRERAARQATRLGIRVLDNDLQQIVRHEQVQRERWNGETRTVRQADRERAGLVAEKAEVSKQIGEKQAQLQRAADQLAAEQRAERASKFRTRGPSR